MTFKTPLLKIAFLTLIFAAIIGCKNEDRELETRNAELDSLSNELTEQQELNDSLQYMLEKSELATGFPIYFGREFDTIPNPEEYISESLKSQSEKISMEAVLGGTMEFRQVQVLTEDWVLAVYDDGHVQGTSIFEYELQPTGDIQFSEVASKQPNQR